MQLGSCCGPEPYDGYNVGGRKENAMNDNKRPDPGSTARGGRDKDDAPTNPERDVPRPSEVFEERKPDPTGGSSVLGEEA